VGPSGRFKKRFILPNDFGKKENNMGGVGSGSWFRCFTKDTTGAARKIDVRYLAQQGYLQAGRSWSLYWSCNGEPSGNISGITQETTIVLTYRIREWGAEEWEDVRQTIPLTRTACNFGGERPWLLCPACERRVATLYMGTRARCRHCSNLAYGSQNENAIDRMFRKARRIRRRLGVEESCEAPILFKPKGMHQKTFDHLRKEVQRLESLGWQAMEHKLCSWRRG
jgi:hypothetical protein